MARLPNPGEDADTWGSTLNDFLLVAHDENGRLRTNAVGTEQLQDNAVSVASLDSGVQASLATIQNIYYAPEDYGCSVDASATMNDDAIAAAIKDAIAGSGIVQFTGRGPYKVGRAVDQDVSKFVVRGCKTSLKVQSTFTGPYFWSMFSSADYPYPNNQGLALSGIILDGNLLGSTPLAAAAIQIGHATYVNNSLFTLNEIYTLGFEIGFRFIQNAWRVKVSNCRITGGTAIAAVTGLGNFGENLLFENCFIESWWPKVTIGTGKWNFINTSFNSTKISLEGECMVRLLGCHIEPHDVYPCVSLKHSEAAMIMDDTSLIIEPAEKINNAPFEVIDGNRNKGLTIRNLDMIQSANFNPQINDKNCVLVSGNGRVDMQGFASNTNGYGFAISKGANLLYNGDAELGTTAGWTTYASYGSTSFATDTTFQKGGTKSFRLTVNSSSIYVGQSVACKPGQWVFAQCWNKLQIDSGTGNTSIGIDFMSSRGEIISTIGYTNITTTTFWTCRRNLTGSSPVAPAGTASVRVYITLAGGLVKAWYDELILNVV